MPRQALRGTAIEASFEPLHPPFWAGGAHAQTILGHLLPGPRPAGARAELHHVPLPDGDRLAVHEWLPSAQPVASVALFHGLGGSADADYMQRSVRIACDLGFRAYAVEHRGAGAGRGLARLPYNSGSSSDARCVFEWLRENRGVDEAVGIGFSLSGNVLLKLACEGGVGGLRAVVAINPPCDLASASARIARVRNRVYELRFMRKLNRQIDERVRDGLLDRQPRVPWSAHLVDFDEHITAPLAGFSSAQEYYARCSTHERLREIETPTLILSARDDPFVDIEGLEGAERSDAVTLHVEAKGGHMGYLGRGARPWTWTRWLDGALGRILGSF